MDWMFSKLVFLLLLTLVSGSAAANGTVLNDADGQHKIRWFTKDGGLVWVSWSIRLRDADADGFSYKDQMWRFDCANRRAQIYVDNRRRRGSDGLQDGNSVVFKKFDGADLKWRTFPVGSVGAQIFSLYCP